MDTNKGEAAWALDSELCAMQVALGKARMMSDTLSRYFDTLDKEAAVKKIADDYKKLNAFSEILFDYILMTQNVLAEVVGFQECRRGHVDNLDAEGEK